MRVAARYIHRQILLAVLFVTLSFLALFLFFDVINEVNFSSSNAAVRYTVLNSMVYVALLVPEHVYELLPIAVLIGAIFVMANMAMTSEFTILRTSGGEASPVRTTMRRPALRSASTEASLQTLRALKENSGCVFASSA